MIYLLPDERIEHPEPIACDSLRVGLRLEDGRFLQFEGWDDDGEIHCVNLAEVSDGSYQSSGFDGGHL